jgi:hypothetical protein
MAEAVAMAVFATAHGVTALFAARMLQGLATGMATGAAALIPGALLTLSGLYLRSLPTLFAATVLAGARFGAVTKGALRLLVRACSFFRSHPKLSPRTTPAATWP